MDVDHVGDDSSKGGEGLNMQEDGCQGLYIYKKKT